MFGVWATLPLVQIKEPEKGSAKKQSRMKAKKRIKSGFKKQTNKKNLNKINVKWSHFTRKENGSFYELGFFFFRFIASDFYILWAGYI